MIVDADPGDIHDRLRDLHSGVCLKLKKGRYREPIVLSGVSGTQDHPIVIRGPKATIGFGAPYEAYRKKANELSAVQEAGGLFPGIYYLADDAQLILRNCQWVVIEDLRFEGCWPTAVYIDDCQHITLRRLSFRGGTIAIGAYGPNTRHLLIEDCDWIQDVSARGEKDLKSIRRSGRLRHGDRPADNLLWSQTAWRAVHGDLRGNGSLVDIGADARAFDGDFFRAWTIPGYVIIRNNCILDAFNAIHFFNQAAESIVEGFSRNVVIENNWFVRLRDNAIEPEHYAWNWTVRHNNFVDCYAPFSFEMARSGFFYIYGNLGWNHHRPGVREIDGESTGRVFKLPETHAADGPHYFFNNTWIVRGPIFKKRRFSRFRHFNNIYAYHLADDADKPALFGSGWAEMLDYGTSSWEDIRTFEEGRFTKDWGRLDIVFDGDIVDHPDFPDAIRAAAYPLGQDCSPGPVEFADRSPGVPRGLETDRTFPRVSFVIELPNGLTMDVAGNVTRAGAWQDGDLARVNDPQFYDLWSYPPGSGPTLKPRRD
ncbi:hypothetical protein MesoLjLc_30260 [Mesorhizobium sp. L-8-10]|uniref:right-handed parallel beta-helix repeat-containing protein n=1 Tax=Mesorhizobium sp. L-8-10 TaxID=2744523 RepID=UPI0019265828|nr:right-handed parallel beta-helix repeat-containing protein [Mesorhizobium sp. L-8-10]BCH31096.1 hypothetical protein MesoLjLc_30260 [Mesorhizobium sp. L-8-10]